MSILDDVNNNRIDIEFEIGEFEILDENTGKCLLKASDGLYYFLWNEDSHLQLENITWAITKVLSKKKKKKYINDNRRKKETLTNGSR